MVIKDLNSKTYKYALVNLASVDKDLGAVLKTFGPPPMWSRDPGFPTLISIVLEQQVSLASARVAFERLKKSVPELTPGNFLKLDDVILRQIGFSRQKSRYCRNIAIAIEEGALHLDEFIYMSDDRIRSELHKITGIGPWTADIYLLMALNRPDIWPVGDLALISAIQKVKNLPERPTAEEFKMLGDPWKPWRAVAARILWHLMTHSSGFRNPTWPWGGDKKWHPHEPTEWSQLVAMFPYTEILFKPGSQHSYSNTRKLSAQIRDLLFEKVWSLFLD